MHDASAAPSANLEASFAPSHRPARIAVTGATGCLGRHFIFHVLRNDPDVRITALVRSKSPAALGHPALCDARVTCIVGDLTSLHRLSRPERRMFAEADGGLWHFAASTVLQPRGADVEAHNWRINHAGTRTLLDLHRQCDRPGPLFHVSTAYVCGRRSGRIRESDLAHAAGFRNSYEASKHAAELHVRQALDAGCAGAIFRPSLVMAGASQGGVGYLAQAISRVVQLARSGINVTLRMPASAGVNAVRIDDIVPELWRGRRFAQTRKTYHLTAEADVTIGDVAMMMPCPDGETCLSFAPDAPLESLTKNDRMVDRFFSPFRPYFASDLSFDDRNSRQDLLIQRSIGVFDLRAHFLESRDGLVHSASFVDAAAG